MALFRDRREAAEFLADRLRRYAGRKDAVVLTKKIGHPENPEFAIGAVSLGAEDVDGGGRAPARRPGGAMTTRTSSAARAGLATLPIVGDRDVPVLGLNEEAARRLHAERRLELVAGAAHLPRR
jgi:pimeloyl-ACP methyl ester carboxylesterase